MNDAIEPKVDCHVHVFDPAHFPYAAARAGSAQGDASVFRFAAPSASACRQVRLKSPSTGSLSAEQRQTAAVTSSTVPSQRESVQEERRSRCQGPKAM